MIRLLRLLPPETAHNLTIFLLSIAERWEDFLWRMRAAQVGRNAKRQDPEEGLDPKDEDPKND
jgi:hypothetical protein